MVRSKNIFGFVLAGALMLPGVVCGMDNSQVNEKKNQNKEIEKVVINSNGNNKSKQDVLLRSTSTPNLKSHLANKKKTEDSLTYGAKKHKRSSSHFIRNTGLGVLSIGACLGVCYGYHWTQNGDLKKTLQPLFKIAVPVSFLGACWFCVGKQVTDGLLNKLYRFYKREKFSLNNACGRKMDEIKHMGKELEQKFNSKARAIYNAEAGMMRSFVKKEQAFRTKLANSLEEKANTFMTNMVALVSTKKAEKMKQQFKEKKDNEKIIVSYNNDCNNNNINPLGTSQFTVIKTEGNTSPSSLIKEGYMEKKSENGEKLENTIDSKGNKTI